VHRLVLIRLIEERGPSPAGFALLMGEVERGADEARTLALGALWRLGAGAEALGTDWLDDRAAEEIARLKLYAGLIRQIPYDVPFERFFLAEVDRAAAEAREAEAVRQSLVPDNVAAMRRAVAKLESEAASKGQRLLSEAEYSLKTHGYVSFPLYLIMGNYYVIAIVGSRVTTFTAKIGGGGFNTLVLDERYVDGDVFVRSNGFTNDGRTNEATPSVFITADGGNRGAVQVLVFTQD